jgi:dTMP kinase
LLITLEGVDGSGKSTQAALLAEALGPGTVLLQEPGGTEAAEAIRAILADPDLPLDPMAEMLLFLGARADLVSRVIRPALDESRDVVLDRFIDSTEAYQGVARGLGAGLVRSLNAEVTGGLVPDLTLLIEVDPEVALGRAVDGGRFEAEGLAFQASVAGAYRGIAAREGGRFGVVDGAGSTDQVHEAVMALVRDRRPA